MRFFPFLMVILFCLTSKCMGQSTLVRVPILDKNAKQIGYKTERNGKPDGQYYLKVDDYDVLGFEKMKDVEITGNVAYKPQAVNYFPAYKVVYILNNEDTITDVFDFLNFQILFSDSCDNYRKIISKTDDSIMQLPQTYPYLEIEFNDPAIIPIGKWIVSRKNQIIFDISYDSNGNYIEVFEYRYGKLSHHIVAPPCNKRKFLKRNPDGSVWGEECVDYKKKFGK